MRRYFFFYKIVWKSLGIDCTLYIRVQIEQTPPPMNAEFDTKPETPEISVCS
jgi:hypothetical protein